jgi:hypothetical protein
MSGWWLGWTRKRQADLEEEIRAHLAMAKQDRMDWKETPELLVGLFPALQTLRLSVARTLREAGTRSVTNAGSSSRKVLVVSQVALSLVLLVGAGLLIKTFAKLSDVSPGFDARNVLTMKMSLSLDTTKATARLSERAVSKLESLPVFAAWPT